MANATDAHHTLLVLRIITTLGALACIGSLAMAGGCASSSSSPSPSLAASSGATPSSGDTAPTLKDEAEFKSTVTESDSPVLVDFYKGGCPACIALEPTINRLHDQYKDRMVVTRFMLVTPYFAVTSKEIQQRYNIVLFPTVILFDHHQEVKRWVTPHEESEYRQAMDEALRAASQPAGAGK